MFAARMMTNRHPRWIEFKETLGRYLNEHPVWRDKCRELDAEIDDRYEWVASETSDDEVAIDAMTFLAEEMPGANLHRIAQRVLYDMEFDHDFVEASITCFKMNFLLTDTYVLDRTAPGAKIEAAINDVLRDKTL